MTQKLGISKLDSKRQSVYDPPFDGQVIWICCIFVGDINLKKKNSRPWYNINFQVINTTELYILFKIVSFIILVTFVAFWFLSFNWSVHILFILNTFNTPAIPGKQHQVLTNSIHADKGYPPPFVKRKTPFILYLGPLFIPKSTCLRICVLYIHSVQIQQFFNV